MSEAVVTNSNQALWEKGDFTQIARMMRNSGDQLVASFDVRPPLRVLDLGCGDGTTAFPLARAGAEVVGIDIARNLVEAGNARAAEAGLDRLTFQYGDACNLEGVPDQAFDLTISIFGAMFAPKPFDVAREIVRVTKPGGRIIMGNWIPSDDTSYVSRLLAISAAFTPPPPDGFVSPMTWGVEKNVIERFGQAGVPADRIAFVKDVFPFVVPGKTVPEFVDIFRNYYGPTMNAYAAAAQNGREDELHRQILQLAAEQNTAGAGGVAIYPTFLRGTVQL